MNFTHSQWIMFIVTTGILVQSIVQLPFSKKSLQALGFALIAGGCAIAYVFYKHKVHDSYDVIQAFVLGYVFMYVYQVNTIILPKLTIQSLLVVNILFIFYYFSGLPNLQNIFKNLSLTYLSWGISLTVVPILLIALQIFPLTRFVRIVLYVWYLIMSSIIVAFAAGHIYFSIKDQATFTPFAIATWFSFGMILLGLLVNLTNLDILISRRQRYVAGGNLTDIYDRKFASDRFSPYQILMVATVGTLALYCNLKFFHYDQALLLNIILIAVQALTNRRGQIDKKKI